jgi:rubredoxin
MFKCTVCGYVHEGDDAPEKCPKCGAPKEKFDNLAGEAKEKIERSRMTNDLHMQLLGLLEDAVVISTDGIEDALDPACVAIFKKTKAEGEILIQSIKAELEGHVKKGKWG